MKINEVLLEGTPEHNIRFEKIHLDSHSQQHDYELIATANNTVVGTMSYTVFENVPHINMIEVNPEYRNNGIGALLVKELTKKHNKYDKAFAYSDIVWGLTTSDGNALKNKLDKELL